MWNVNGLAGGRRQHGHKLRVISEHLSRIMSVFFSLFMRILQCVPARSPAPVASQQRRSFASSGGNVAVNGVIEFKLADIGEGSGRMLRCVLSWMMGTACMHVYMYVCV